MERQHLWHLFTNERYGFGVTNPLRNRLLSRLLGTAPPPSQVPRSATAREVGGPSAEHLG